MRSLRPVLWTLFFVLGLEAAAAGAGYVWLTTRDDDPLATVTISRQWVGKLYSQRQQERAAAAELIEKLQGQLMELQREYLLLQQSGRA